MANVNGAPEGWVEGLWYPVADLENFNPDRFDFRWNADYTEFCPVRLRWWDDASYAAWQGDFAEPAEIPGGDEEVLF